MLDSCLDYNSLSAVVKFARDLGSIFIMLYSFFTFKKFLFKEWCILGPVGKELPPASKLDLLIPVEKPLENLSCDAVVCGIVLASVDSYKLL